jgi:hypothetical protein
MRTVFGWIGRGILSPVSGSTSNVTLPFRTNGAASIADVQAFTWR